MTDKKNFIPTFKVYGPKDMAKRWFVYWYEGKKRCVKYGDINQFDTPMARRKEAQKIIRELKIELIPKLSPLEKQVREWMEKKKPFWRKKSYKTYDSVANIFFEWLGTRKITPRNIQLFFEHLAQNRTASTYNKYKFRLKQMFDGVGVEGLLDHIDTAKGACIPARYFQKHQVARLKKCISKNDPELWLFIQIYILLFYPARRIAVAKGRRYSVGRKQDYGTGRNF